MFNLDNRVRLSEFKQFGEVVRDVGFFGVGKIPSRVPFRLVPVTKPGHLKDVLRHDDIAAVLCPPSMAGDVPANLGCLASDNPIEAAYHIHADLASRPDYYWTRFDSRIASNARIAPGAIVSAEDVIIGEDSIVEAGAIILPRSVIGDRVLVGAGTVIGTQAFELARIGDLNRLQQQVGGVRVGSDSIFLSGIMVARSIFATFTEIGRNCAFDNLVHVAHDCVIQDRSQLTACAMLAGRVELATDTFIGPNSSISNGISVGEGGSVSIGSTVVRDVEAGQKVTGYFATDHRSFLRNLKRPDE